jgi:FdhD protein
MHRPEETVILPEPPEDIQHGVIRVRDGLWSHERDTLAGEEPMEIRLAWEQNGRASLDSIAVTMRTPGNDFELAVGFLHGEGIITGREDYVDVSYCVDGIDPQTMNIVTVTLRPDLTFDMARLERHFYTTSSCGVCGKATLEALDIRGCSPLQDGPRIGADMLCTLPTRLRESQAIFERTGGLHASGLFDVEGNLVGMKEDVGRHNALDKVIGEQIMAGHNMDGTLLVLSGRASFELLQKALMARIPLVAAVGAPSSLAVQIAERFNITLLGFVRPDGFNIYAGADRVLTPDAAVVGDEGSVHESRH